MPNLNCYDNFMQRLMTQVEEDSDEDKLAPLTVAQRRFLQAYTVTGTISGAAKRAKSCRKSHYAWCRNSPAYRHAFVAAETESRDAIMEACRKVAIEDESVPMLIHLSKGAFPELYNTQKHELSGPDGKDIQVRTEAATVDQLLGKMHDIMQRRQEAVDTSSDPAGLLEGPDNGVADSEE
jgi:hypothetical protein